MTAVRRTVLALLVSAATACGGSSAPDRPEPLEPSTPSLSICEAAQEAVGERIRVEAIFDGFAYDTESRHVTLIDGEICNNRGAGLVFAELYHASEREHLLDALPGTSVVVLEGTVTKLEEDGFVHLDEAIVAR